MNPHLERSRAIWTAQSQLGYQRLAAGFCSVVGGLLLLGFRHFDEANGQAGFFLGLLLLVIGVWSWLSGGRQTITIDPTARRITIQEERSLGRSQVRSIGFDEIAHVGLAYLGKKSNFVQSYYLTLTLRSGAHTTLFAPGRFYAGTSDRAVVQGWRDRLERELHA